MAQFCESCGVQLKEGDRFCESCGAPVAAPPSPAPAEAPVEAQATVVKEEKNPVLAVILSFFFPGLGSVYNGDTLKGVAIYIGVIIGVFIFVIPGLIVWVFGMYDAYTTSKKMNEGQVPFKPANTVAMIAFIVIVLVVGGIAFAIGTSL